MTNQPNANKTKKIIILSLLALIFIAMAATPALAAEQDMGIHGVAGVAGQSDVTHIELVSKDPTTWEVDDTTAWGKIQFDCDSFVFNGHHLAAGDYSLVLYTDDWPNVVVLAAGTAKDNGNLHLMGSLEAPLPSGGKIWLVPSADITGSVLNKWNPTDIFFEWCLIP